MRNREHSPVQRVSCDTDSGTVCNTLFWYTTLSIVSSNNKNVMLGQADTESKKSGYPHANFKWS